MLPIPKKKNVTENSLAVPYIYGLFPAYAYTCAYSVQAVGYMVKNMFY